MPIKQPSFLSRARAVVSGKGTMTTNLVVEPRSCDDLELVFGFLIGPLSVAARDVSAGALFWTLVSVTADSLELPSPSTATNAVTDKTRCNFGACSDNIILAGRGLTLFCIVERIQPRLGINLSTFIFHDARIPVVDDTRCTRCTTHTPAVSKNCHRTPSRLLGDLGVVAAQFRQF